VLKVKDPKGQLAMALNIELASSMRTPMHCHEDLVMMAASDVRSGRRWSKWLMLLFKLTFNLVCVMRLY